jgi:hypothetical protein
VAEYMRNAHLADDEDVGTLMRQADQEDSGSEPC